MAITPNTTFTAGDVLTADEMNRLPWGIVAYAEKTASQTGITTAADVTSLTATWTAISSRYYRTTIYCAELFQNTSNSQGRFFVTDLSRVQKQVGFNFMLATQIGSIAISVIETGLSGSITRKLRASTDAGSLTINASATSPAYIVVEDLGQA